MKKLELWRNLGNQLRVDSIRASSIAGSGHPTSSMSAADLMSVLLTKYLRYNFEDPEDIRKDHLILSKGHASPLLYSMFKAVGAITDEELLDFRKLGSMLQGHPTPLIPWVKVATGSLGQGLPIGTGLALAGKKFNRLPYHVWVLCGDSEMAEGSMWEAIEMAGFSRLNNLIAIVDMNRLGQRGETMHKWNAQSFINRAKASGWNAMEIDGHDHIKIDQAYKSAIASKTLPTLIVATTIKAKGVTSIENKNGFHGKVLDDPDAAIKELGGIKNIIVRPPSPKGNLVVKKLESRNKVPPTYQIGTKVATRKAYGETLAVLGESRTDLVVLDAEVGNSTHSEIFANAHPERYFETYIAEQQLIASSIAMQAMGWVPFASTFAAFLTRAFDFIRMAAISRANIKIVGSHAGVSIGEDGPSQMGLEDIAMFRSVHGSTVLYPSDANQTSKLVSEMVDLTGVVYLRTTREDTPTIYGANESFPVGGSKVLCSSDSDDVTIIAAGITVHEALSASEILAVEGIRSRVIDLYSIKPIDSATLLQAARINGKLITVEDHWADGGLGDAVLNVFADSDVKPRIVKLAVRDMPGSGTPSELRDSVKISAEHIANSARGLIINSSHETN